MPIRVKPSPATMGTVPSIKFRLAASIGVTSQSSQVESRVSRPRGPQTRRMKVFYSDTFVLPLPPNHRFSMEKFSLLRQRVVDEELVHPNDMSAPEPASEAQLALAHDPDYVVRVFRGNLTPKELRRIGFPWSVQMVERSRRSVAATIGACRAAISEGTGINLSGGTHHAHRDFGAGFCVFNDVAVAARVIQTEGLARSVIVLDCDVHQGDGTASIFANDPSVFTFSIHSASNYPFHKASSDLDIALPDGTGDNEYMEALQYGARRALSLSMAEFAVYVAGADPFGDDRLGRFALTKEGLALRDLFVLRLCREARLPVAVVMGGGYSHRVHDTVDIHFRTVELAIQIAASSS